MCSEDVFVSYVILPSWSSAPAMIHGEREGPSATAERLLRGAPVHEVPSTDATVCEAKPIYTKLIIFTFPAVRGVSERLLS